MDLKELGKWSNVIQKHQPRVRPEFVFTKKKRNKAYKLKQSAIKWG